MTRLKGNFIAGEWVWPGSGKSFDRTNPARPDELVSTAPESSAQDVDEAISHLTENRHGWAATSPDKRAKVIDELLTRKEFSEIWVQKWAELLQVRTTNTVKRKATLLYYEWLQSKIAGNVPAEA